MTERLHSVMNNAIGAATYSEQPQLATLGAIAMTEPKSPSGKGGRVKKTPKNPDNYRGVAVTGAGPGRPKGVPNKSTQQLKEMILAALDASGGVDYLVQRANDERTAGAFLSLVGKVLPMTVSGDAESPVKIEFTWVK